MSHSQDTATATDKASAAKMPAAWLIVGFGFILMFLVTGPIYQSYSVLSLNFGQEFGAKKFLIGLMFSGCVVMQRLMAACIGPMFDRMAVRWLVVFGLVGVAGTLAAASQVAAIWQMALLYVVVLPFVSTFASGLPANVMIARRLKHNLGLAFGLAFMGSSLGLVVIPTLTARLLDAMSWRSVYLVYGVFPLLLLPVALVLLRGVIGGRAADLPAARAADGAAPAVALTLAAALRRPVFWAISLGVGAMLAASSAIAVSIVHLGVENGLSVKAAGLLASLMGVGAMVGKLAFGALADRFGQQNALRLGLICCAAGSALLISGSYAVLYAGAFVAGLSQGGMLPVYAAACKSEFGLANYGKAMGWTGAAMIPLILLLPAAAGRGFDAWGTYTPSLLGISATLLVALVVHWAIMARSGSRPSVAAA